MQELQQLTGHYSCHESFLTVQEPCVESDEAIGSREAEPPPASKRSSQRLVRHHCRSSGVRAQVKDTAGDGVLRLHTLGDASLIGIEVELMAAAVGSRVHPPLH